MKKVTFFTNKVAKCTLFTTKKLFSARKLPLLESELGHWSSQGQNGQIPLFGKICRFYHCLRNIQQSNTLLELEFYKLEFHKKWPLWHLELKFHKLKISTNIKFHVYIVLLACKPTLIDFAHRRLPVIVFLTHANQH